MGKVISSFHLTELPVPLVYATHRVLRDCNELFAQLFGYEREELLDTGFHLLYPKFTDFVRTGEMWRTNFDGGRVYNDERIMLRRDHSRFWCRVSGLTRSATDPFADAVYCFEQINRPTSQNNFELTARQLQIVTLVAQGKKNREIADEVKLSSRTVEAHRARIMKSVGVRNAAELVTWYQHAQDHRDL